MPFRLQFSLKHLFLELLILTTAMGFTKASMSWMHFLSFAPGRLTLLEVMAAMLCQVLAAGFWGAAIGGLFGQMKTGARIAAYLVLIFLTAFVLICV